MDITEWRRERFIALMEGALGGRSPETIYQVELTITPSHAEQSTPNTMPYYRLVFMPHEELSFIAHSLRASSAPTSSSMQE